MSNNNVPKTDYCFDIETYFDLFCVDLTHVESRTRFIFEVSDRRDQSREFIQFIYRLRDANARLFGFNNLGFDWPVIDKCLNLAQTQGHFTALDAHRFAQQIFDSQNGPDRWSHQVWPSDRIVTQGDLFKIHHFDNRARSTSLKKLELNPEGVVMPLMKLA